MIFSRSLKKDHDLPERCQSALNVGARDRFSCCLTLSSKSTFIFFQIEVCILGNFSTRR